MGGISMRLTLVFSLLTACSPPGGLVSKDAITSSCAVATGIYLNEATLRSKDGDCPRMKDHTRDKLQFEEGEFISPGAALIPCATQQNECTLTIACQVLDLEMRFTGEMTEDASRLVGVATFSGTGACRSAIYDMDAAWRPDLSP